MDWVYSTNFILANPLCTYHWSHERNSSFCSSISWLSSDIAFLIRDQEANRITLEMNINYLVFLLYFLALHSDLHSFFKWYQHLVFLCLIISFCFHVYHSFPFKKKIFKIKYSIPHVLILKNYLTGNNWIKQIKNLSYACLVMWMNWKKLEYYNCF